MQRITIIGCGGSGKSTLAGELGRLLGLPVYHLDRLYWKPGWVETPKPEWTLTQEGLCGQSAWIMDGNYGGTMDIRLSASDTVIFLDLPTRICLWGAFQRFFNYRGSTRPDMTEGCPERLNLEYLWWICTYRRKRRLQILRKLQQLGAGTRVVILESRRSAKEFLDAIAQRKTCQKPV